MDQGMEEEVIHCHLPRLHHPLCLYEERIPYQGKNPGALLLLLHSLENYVCKLQHGPLFHTCHLNKDFSWHGGSL